MSVYNLGDVAPELPSEDEYWIAPRLRTHSQKSTVAARAMADRKTVGHRS